jgi:membrane protein DedA with SNARE-associated domain
MTPITQISAFSGIIGWGIAHGYLLMFIVAVIEGPILGVVCGLLIHLGYFQFWPIYAVLMAGDLTGDVIWYNVGRHGIKRFINRFGHLFSLDEKNVAYIERIFRKHETRTLIISKITAGFGFSLLTLMTAGSIGVPFKKYMTINFLGQFFWSGFVIAVGYYFGQFYQAIDASFRVASLVAFIAIVALILYGVQKYARSTVIRNKA